MVTEQLLTLDGGSLLQLAGEARWKFLRTCDSWHRYYRIQCRAQKQEIDIMQSVTIKSCEDAQRQGSVRRIVVEIKSKKSFQF